MSEALTFDVFREMAERLAAIPAAPEIHVFDFREQWRFPRTKKRRIRRKWERRMENWRVKPGQAYLLNLPGKPPAYIVGRDVKRALDAKVKR
jgi:hypothetical protein